MNMNGSKRETRTTRCTSSFWGIRSTNTANGWQRRGARRQRTPVVPPVPKYPDELQGPQGLQQATALYNGMIHPLAPFAMRGAIWYQGEANESEGMKYFERMKALIGGWRKIWDEGDFPILFCANRPIQLRR